MAQPVFAARQRLAAGEQLDQGRLARSVPSDQGNTLGALDHEADVTKHFLGAIALGDMVELGDDPPAGLGLRKRKVDGFFFRRNLDALDLFQFLDAALHLLGFGGLVAEAIDKDLELFDSVALIAVGRLQLLIALRLLRHVFVVVAGVEP